MHSTFLFRNAPNTRMHSWCVAFYSKKPNTRTRRVCLELLFGSRSNPASGWIDGWMDRFGYRQTRLSFRSGIPVHRLAYMSSNNKLPQWCILSVELSGIYCTVLLSVLYWLEVHWKGNPEIEQLSSFSIAFGTCARVLHERYRDTFATAFMKLKHADGEHARKLKICCVLVDSWLPSTVLCKHGLFCEFYGE